MISNVSAPPTETLSRQNPFGNLRPSTNSDCDVIPEISSVMIWSPICQEGIERMKKRYSEDQIIGILRDGEAGIAMKDLCRKHGFSEASY